MDLVYKLAIPILCVAIIELVVIIWLVASAPAGAVTIAPCPPCAAPASAPSPNDPALSAVQPSADDQSTAIMNAYNAEVPTEGFVEYRMRGNKLILGAPWAKV